MSLEVKSQKVGCPLEECVLALGELLEVGG